jgi:hypothetical protein
VAAADQVLAQLGKGGHDPAVGRVAGDAEAVEVTAGAGRGHARDRRQRRFAHITVPRAPRQAGLPGFALLIIALTLSPADC